MRLAEQLKDVLTVQEVILKYGFELNYRNAMCCPFHNEKTASLIVHKNNKSWKCYGCGEGGTVIDFVMKLYNINFGQACIRLNSDFNLGFTDERPNQAEIRRRRAQDFRKRQQDKRVRQEYDSLAEEHRRLLWTLSNMALTNGRTSRGVRGLKLLIITTNNRTTRRTSRGVRGVK
ncbi:MAG: CHC2 zinc finger domain-containing protein [Christensenella sp.]